MTTATCSLVIDIPDDGHHDGPWQITSPLLKLALKYGAVPDSPWHLEHNWSVEFDHYAMERARTKGPPCMADLAMTMLMNSGIRMGGLKGLSAWLADPETKPLTARLAGAFPPSGSLLKATQSDLDALLAFADAAMEVPRIGPATTFKWLAAWRPAHVPMLDSLVVKVLTGREKPADQTPRLALPRFKALLARNNDALIQLGLQVSTLVGNERLKPVPPVRVLDTLLWFDWWVGGKNDKTGMFNQWIIPNAIGEHQLTAAGRKAERALFSRLEGAA